MLEFTILQPPEALAAYVECFRISNFRENSSLSLKVCPTGYPEIVFQHSHGESAIENIQVDSGRVVRPPLVFVHGQVTEVAVMNFRGPYTTIQAVLKPNALQSLFGLDAAGLADSSTTLDSLVPQSPSARSLDHALVDAPSDEQRIEALCAFLKGLETADHDRDLLVEESISLIARNIATVTVSRLLASIGLSERQFERRFVRAVGIRPQFFIRVRRVNEAFRLMDTGRFERLSDVAYELNFYDQSHFIREVKTFSGITPRSISQRVNDFHNDVVASSYLLR